LSAILKNPLLRLRIMQTDDVDEVMDVEVRAYPHPWTKAIFYDCLRVGYCCWVMEIDGRLIGHGIMSIAAGEAHILNVCVDPDFQGRGLGRKILQRLMALAKDHQVQTLFLEVRCSNKVAQVLYESEGFNEIGRRPAYYPGVDKREDALVFAKELV